MKIDMDAPIYTVKMAQMLSIFGNPFDKNPWGYGTTIKDVEDALNANRLAGIPLSSLESPYKSRIYHAERIAYLVTYKTPEPIYLEIQCPALGLYKNLLLDGWHRYSASFYRKDKMINITYGGGVADFFKLFPEAKEIFLAVI